MRIFTVLLSCFFLFLLSANSMAQTMSISGQVFETKYNESLPFTQVALYSLSSTDCLSGTLTDSLGFFTLSVEKNQSYKILIQYLGYQTFEKIIEVKDSDINLGIISISPSAQSLQEVFVTAEKKPVGKENGNWVMYPDKLPAGGTNSTIDLLSTLPAVSIDMDEQISVRGREVSILIDGVKADDPDIVNQISPSSIAKIEVIQNPSAKYDADASVINILLKTPMASKSSSRFKASIDHLGNHQENFFANKSYKNWGGFIQGSYNYNKFDWKVDMKRENHLNTNTPFIFQNRKQTQKSLTRQIRGGLNHNISQKHIFKLDAQWQNNQFDPNYDTHKEYSDSDLNVFRMQEQNQKNKRDRNTALIRAQYIGKWDDQSLKFRFSFKNQGQNEIRSMESNNYSAEGILSSTNPNLRNDDLELDINKYQSNIDYEKNYTKSLSIETGGDLGFDSQNQNSLQEKYNHWKDKWLLIPSKTFDYKYEKLTSAVYAILNKKTDNWFISGGSRIRYIKQKTENLKDEVLNKQNNSYLSFLPTISLGISTEKMDLTFSYKKSQKLPRSSQLNSYRNDANPLNIYFGNPDLKPEKEHSLSLDYSLHSVKYQGGLALFQRVVKDVVMQKYYAKGDTLFRTYDNLADQFVSGLELTFSYKITNWCRLNGSGTVFYQKYTGQNLSLPQKDLCSYNYKIASQLSLAKKTQLHVNYSNNSKSLLQYGFKGDLHNLDFAISQDLFNKQLKFSLKAINVLDSKDQWSEVENMQFSSRTNRYQDTRRLVLGVIYKWSHSN